MPSKSKKQSKFMTANCKSAKFRKKTGMSKKVACDYHKADKGKFHEGSLFDSLMAMEDLVRDKVELAKDLIDAHPKLADILLGPLEKKMRADVISDKRKDASLKVNEISLKNKNSNVSEFLDEFYEKSQPHPFDSKTRLIGPIGVSLSPFGGDIHISDMMNYGDMKQGHASSVLKFLVGLADKYDIKLSLFPKAYAKGNERLANRGAITKDSDLVKWYKKYGFVKSGDEMIYNPKKSVNEGFKPSTFLRVGRNLVELQMGWLAENNNKKAYVKVFVNGRNAGHYTFEGKNYKVDDANQFQTAEEAIGYLIQTNAPETLPKSRPTDFLRTLNSY